MTDKQIKQNAWNDLGRYTPCDENEWIDGYVVGAHSRDEEVKHIEEKYVFCRKKMIKFNNELNKLQNPWIDVKDHLPEMFVDSKGITHDFSVKVLVTNENNPNCWHVAEYYPDKSEWCCLEHPIYIIDNVTHWMPIPKLN